MQDYRTCSSDRLEAVTVEAVHTRENQTRLASTYGAPAQHGV